MGLFSSKTKVYVASSLWNLAGDPDQRPDLVPSLVISAVLSGSDQSIGEQLQTSLRSATALRNRAFFRWAVNHYALGMPSGQVGEELTLAGAKLSAPLKSALGLGSDRRLSVLSAVIDDSDVEYWVEHWIIANRPDLSEEDWSADFDAGTAEIVISLPAETVRIPAPQDYLWGLLKTDRKLLYVAYQIQTRKADKLWSTGPIQLFTYRMGSGTVAFDRLRPARKSLPEFLPAIPLRIDNSSVRDGDPARYANIRKAFKKLTGARIEPILDMIEDHENVDDMDHVLVVPGVPLNTKDAAGQAYLYEFFKGLMGYQQAQFDGEAFLEGQVSSIASQVAHDRWIRANGEETGAYTNPFWNKVSETAEALMRAKAPRNEMQIRMAGLTEYDFRLRWAQVSESQHTGNARRFDGTARPRLKKGQYWFTVLPELRVPLTSFYNDRSGTTIQRTEGLSRIALFHQYETNRYRMLTVSGLEHANYVYGDKSVTIQATEALTDDEESGFLVPLHNPSLKRLGAFKGAKLAGCSVYVVVNSYQKVKQRWWQRGIFKVILFAAAIVISAISAGAGLAAVPGVLGTNAAVGAMLGATAATAALVGAVANGIAAVVMTTLISRASVALLGEKLGQIIGTIISFVSLQVGAGFAQTGSMSVDWGSLMRADNLMRLTDSVAGAYSRWLAMDTADIYGRMVEAGEEYAAQLKELQDKADDILGMTNIVIDPMMFTDAADQFGERSEVFLGRTLLTGSELAQMSHALIDSFVELTLELPGAL